MNARSEAGRAWQRDVPARALRAWSGEQLSLLARNAGDVLSGWAADWGLAAGWSDPVCCTPAQAGPGAWTCLGGEGDMAAWTGSGDGWVSELTAALFGGTPQVTPLLQEIADACREDALGRLRSFLHLPAHGVPAEPSAALLSSWGGAVVLDLPFGWRVLLACGLVQAATAAAKGASASQARGPQRAALSAIGDAIGARELRMQVQLEGCEVDIGTLQDLQVGDVLRLRQGLDLPAAVSLAGGAPICRGFLVRSRGRKAIELARASA